MKVIRTFAAVLIDEDIRRKVAEVQSQVKKLAPDVKWVAPENFHITLKFLGDVREDNMSQVIAALEEAVQGFSAFDLAISGVGAFPNPARARVVWVGSSDGCEKMVELASSIDKKLSELGFEKEEKSFKAHITIGRVKTSRFLRALAEGIGKVDADNLGIQRVSGVALMQSELGREGPTYTPIRVIKLMH
ncbi:MAG: RNA 2',3'-cyclic phosphodiesterase [Armatimonadota bacterium]|nr:RNA 2',3'-cyclic phosphodiesterase [bacterium]